MDLQLSLQQRTACCLKWTGIHLITHHFRGSPRICFGSVTLLSQGVVNVIGTVVTDATGVKKRSRGQGMFLVLVKQSKTILKLSNSGQDVYILCMCIAHSVVKCVQSKGPGPVCGGVK